MKKKDAYFLAKNQMKEAIAGRIEKLKAEYQAHMNQPPGNPDRLPKALELQTRIDELEKMHSYVRNVLLWDTRLDGKPKKKKS